MPTIYTTGSLKLREFPSKVILMQNRKQIPGSDLILISGLVSLMLLVFIGWAWMPDTKNLYSSTGDSAGTNEAAPSIASWVNEQPISARYSPRRAQDPASGAYDGLEWESEDVAIEYRRIIEDSYLGEFDDEPDDTESISAGAAEAYAEMLATPAPLGGGIFSPPVRQEDPAAQDEPGETVGPDAPQSPAVAATQENPTTSQPTRPLPPPTPLAQADRPLPELPPLMKENPKWWVEDMQMPLLGDRSTVFASLDEIIFVALQNSPQIHILNSQPRIQELVVLEETAAFDWANFIETTWNDQNLPIGSTLDTGDPAGRFLQREFNLNAGLSRQLLSGGSLRIGQNFGTFDNNSTFITPPDQGNARLLVDYRQPLLRGAGRKFTTSQIVLARLDLERVNDGTLQELQSFLIDVVSAYWEVYLQRASLVQNRRSTERAGRLLEQLKNRDDVDVSNDQLLRAEAAYSARQSEVIRSEFELVNAQDRLINLAVGPGSRGADSIEMLVEPFLEIQQSMEVLPEQIVQRAIQHRPEVSQALTEIKSATVRQDIARNLLLPQLDAVLTSFITGLRGDEDVGGAFTDQFSVGAPSYTVGVNFEIPIGNRAARSRLERTELQLEVIRRQFEQQVGDVVVDSRIAARNLNRLEKVVANNSRALEKAAQELDLIRQRRRLNLDDGKTGSFYIEDLLASQTRLTIAEQRLVESQSQLAVARVDLKRATGELLRVGDPTVTPNQAAMIPPEVTHQRQPVRPAALYQQSGRRPLRWSRDFGE